MELVIGFLHCMKHSMYGTQQIIVILVVQIVEMIGHKKAETSQSYDFGIEKTINPDLFIDLTYFNVKYFDALEGWSREYSKLDLVQLQQILQAQLNHKVLNLCLNLN